LAKLFYAALFDRPQGVTWEQLIPGERAHYQALLLADLAQRLGAR
jgi:hypothetical protein